MKMVSWKTDIFYATRNLVIAKLNRGKDLVLRVVFMI